MHGEAARLFSDIHTPLFNVLVAGTLGLFGFGVVQAKIITLAFAVAGVILVYRMTLRFFGGQAALAAAALLAFSPVYVQYSQYARSYGLFAVMATTSSYYYLRLWDRDFNFRSKEMIGYSIASLFMLFTHMAAGSILLAQGVHLLVVCIREKRFDRLVSWSKVQVIMLLVYSPVAITILNRYDLRRDIPLIYSWVRMPSSMDLLNSVRYGLEPSWFLSVVLAILLILVLWKARSFVTGYLFAWLIVPALFLFTYSHLHHPVFIGRGLLPSLVPLVILAAIGVDVLFRQRRVGWVVIAVIMATGFAETRGAFDRDEEAWKPLVSMIASSADTGDRSYFVRPGYAVSPFLYYVDRDCFFASDRTACMAKDRIHAVNDESIMGPHSITKNNWFIGYGSEAAVNSRLIEGLKASAALQTKEPRRMPGFEVIQFSPK